MATAAWTVVAREVEASEAGALTVMDAMKGKAISITARSGQGAGGDAADLLRRQALLFPLLPQTMRLMHMTKEKRERMTLSARTSELCLSTNWS